MAYQIIKKTGTRWVKQPNRLVKAFPSGLCMIQQDYIAAKSDVDYFAFREGDAITDSEPCIDGAYIFPAPDYQDMGNGFVKCTVTAYGRVNTSGTIEESFDPKSISGIEFRFNNVNLNTYTELVTSLNDPNFVPYEINITPDYYRFGVPGLLPTIRQKIVINQSEASIGLESPNVEFNPVIVFPQPNFGVPFNVFINQIFSVWGTSNSAEYLGQRFYITGSTFIGYSPSPSSQATRFDLVTNQLQLNDYSKQLNLNLIRSDSTNYGFFTEYIYSYTTDFKIQLNVTPKPGGSAGAS